MMNDKGWQYSIFHFNGNLPFGEDQLILKFYGYLNIKNFSLPAPSFLFLLKYRRFIPKIKSENDKSAVLLRLIFNYI